MTIDPEGVVPRCESVAESDLWNSLKVNNRDFIRIEACTAKLPYCGDER